jgi:hypothetical protein
LPSYGPLATAFPPEWGSRAREGLVVEFVANDGEVWVGNFQPGLGGVNDVLRHPNGRDALVISNGTLWSVNPTTRHADELAPVVFDVWPVADPDGYVLNDQGLAFLRLSDSGILWSTTRISWDGFRNLRFEGEQLTGQAWSPLEDRWLPFSLDLQTGLVQGGSYTGPLAK